MSASIRRGDDTLKKAATGTMRVVVISNNDDVNLFVNGRGAVDNGPQMARILSFDPPMTLLPATRGRMRPMRGQTRR